MGQGTLEGRLSRRYDFLPVHACSLICSVAGPTCPPLFVFAEALLMNVKVTHQAWDNLSSGVPYCRRVASWTQAGSLRLPGDPSHTFALLLDPGRADKTSPLTVLSVLPPG